MVALIAIFAAIAADTDGLQRAELRGILLPGGILFAILLAGAEWVSRGAEAKLRRRAETALRALQVSEERLASILEIAPEAIVAADRGQPHRALQTAAPSMYSAIPPPK